MCTVCLCITCSIQTVSNEENTSQPERTVSQFTTMQAETELTSTQVETSTASTETETIKYYSDQDARDIAKVLLRECGGVSSDTEKACVVWCILNRVDQSGNSIYNILRSPNQFAFSETSEIRNDLLTIAYDVLERWNDEKNGVTDVGRVLPSEYMWFHGNGKHNYFRNKFSGDYTVWNYSLESPYEN